MNSPQTIDDYLDALLGELRVDPRRARRILAEAEDHLRESAREISIAGASEADAARIAIDRFGPPGEVARRFTRGSYILSGALIRPLIASLLLLAAIGFLVVGASGVLAWAFGKTISIAFVSADGPGVTYTAERCKDFLGFHPEAGNCAAAAQAHHFDEVTGRMDFGVLGLVALTAWFFVRRSLRTMERWSLLPRGFTPAVGATAFTLASLALPFAILTWAFQGLHSGAGNNLSIGLASLVAAGGFVIAFARDLQLKLRPEPGISR